jgi:hypothetical protein
MQGYFSSILGHRKRVPNQQKVYEDRMKNKQCIFCAEPLTSYELKKGAKCRLCQFQNRIRNLERQNFRIVKLLEAREII